MKWSFKLGRVAGIDIQIHVTFFLLLLWVALLYWQQNGDIYQVIQGVGFIVALFACVILHEFGHALTARHYGIGTRSITLLPIGGVASLESMPKNPRHEILIALAGPAVNLAIALLLWILTPPEIEQLVIETDSLNPEIVIHGSFIERLIFVNLILAIFNLLPAFPMDGGRVLRAGLSLFMPHLSATRVAASVGQGFALALGLVGLMSNPVLIFIALFVWIGAAAEAGYAQMKSALSKVPASRAMLTDFQTVVETDSLGHAVTLTLQSSQKEFPVARGNAIVGVLTQESLLAGLRQSGESGVVAQFMSKDVAEARVDEPLDEVVERLHSSSCRIVAVMDGNAPAGIINYDNLLELIAMNNAIHHG